MCTLRNINNGLCLRSMCSVCYYFSIGSKFWPVLNFTELHTLTQAPCSDTFLTVCIIWSTVLWFVLSGLMLHSACSAKQSVWCTFPKITTSALGFYRPPDSRRFWTGKRWRYNVSQTPETLHRTRWAYVPENEMPEYSIQLETMFSPARNNSSRHSSCHWEQSVC